MLVSVIICTRNRAESLRKTLESLQGVIVPEGLTAELLVVDNGSTDATAQVVKEAQLANMELRYVYEKNTGLSNARNRGLSETTGEIILFTDDDVRPPPDWIGMMCEPILRNRAEAVLGGIKVPDYLLPEDPQERLVFEQWVTQTETSGERYLEDKEDLIGANMTFTRRVLQTVPSFDPELGAGALGFFEDFLFSRQLRLAGFRLFGNWNAFVEHHFNSSRLTEASYLKMAQTMGRSRAYAQFHFEHLPVKHPWLKLKAVQLYKVCREALTFFARRQGPRPWLIVITYRIGFYRQYLSERRRLPNYERNGLIKRSGIMALPLVTAVPDRGAARGNVRAEFETAAAE